MKLEVQLSRIVPTGFIVEHVAIDEQQVAVTIRAISQKDGLEVLT